MQLASLDDLFSTQASRDEAQRLADLAQRLDAFGAAPETRLHRVSATLEEKLGHPLPISYEDWLRDCHYEKLDEKLTRWLYRQERGFVESMQDVSLKEIARQRISEFSETLKKYIL